MRLHPERIRWILLIAITMLLAACASPVDPAVLAAQQAEFNALQAANQAYSVRDYKTAFAGYMPVAQEGDYWTEARIAYMYHLGLGVERNEGEAQRWYEKAATDGYGPAGVALGYDYMVPLSGSPDYGQALKWFNFESDRGDLDADLDLAIVYEHGLGVAQDHDQALHWLSQFVARQKVAGPWHYKFPKFASGDNTGGFGVALAWVLQQASEQGGVTHCDCHVTTLSFHYQDGQAMNVAVAKSSGDPSSDAAAVTFLQKVMLPPVLASMSHQDRFTVYVTD